MQENAFVHVGMELVQKTDFSVELVQEVLARQLQFLGTSPVLWKRRQNPLSDEGKLLYRCKMG